MGDQFVVGNRVSLRTFHGRGQTPVGIRAKENYWLLVGSAGTVVSTDDVNAVGAHPKGKRVQVRFDRNVQDLGLACHNHQPNSLWIFESDLAIDK